MFNPTLEGGFRPPKTLGGLTSDRLQANALCNLNISHLLQKVNMIKQEKIKFYLYARKSSESEDRQVQSIDDQINRLKQLAVDFGLDIKKIYTEAKSAKKPDNRPVFTEMLKSIEAGEADGILCWQINRLSRNPIDSAKIQWLLQQRVLKAIQTIDRQYLPDDNVLLFSVESGMSNQFILDLSKNVKRGIQSKREKGWYPHIAPNGYLNERLEHTITKDPERFDVMRKAWELMLSGNYTPPKILDILNNEWGFRTRKTKRAGGRPLAQSSIYQIFTNPFYAGLIVNRGIEYQGKHEPMISLAEYDRVQVLLGRRGSKRPQTHDFAFTGMITCGECGCGITAEEKEKYIKSKGEIKKFTYYHCTKQKRDKKCGQPCITQEDLEKQMNDALESITILPKFKDWALEMLNKNNDGEVETRAKIYETQQTALAQTQRELDNLTKMRYRELIDDDEFMPQRDELREKIKSFRQEVGRLEARADEWLEITEQVFQFACHARLAFNDATDPQKKKEIIRTMGINFVLKDKICTIEPKPYFRPIQEGYKALEADYLSLEPMKLPLNKAKTELFDSVLTRWQGR